ncbi:tetratricopeptide repeat protein [Mucilaginibacter sp. SMC90]|uniref:tetratricopeptide repeat protein n=1 Tax=Mucilaginibacter sp. SMC90 TaxID=2929803 RepID=UPI001FB26652|nr:tetratricopeptide repeat protein [Mucilaginibacter sp. SMC90]UOE47756.1 tetratricopeptide repeat protein [Mucilaginibacter sp. SMC90]
MKTLLLFIILIFNGFALFAQKEDEMLASQYMRDGETQKAVDIYQKLYQQNNDRYYDQYFNSLLSLKKFDEAEIITKKIIDRHPQSYEFVIALGRVYNEKGDKSKAEGVYDGLIKNMPSDPTAVIRLSSKFSNVHNIDYALKVLVQGRILMKNDQLFALEMSTLYRYKNNKVDMLKEYLTLLQTKPDYISDAKRNISAMFDGAQDYTMLKTYLLKMIKQYPDQLVFADLLTWQFLQQKQFDTALSQAMALNRRQNDDGKSIDELCQILVANEAYDEAIRGYQYIIDKGKEHALYEKARIELINTKNLKLKDAKHGQADLAELERNYLDLLTEFGRTPSTAPAMEKLAILQAFQLNRPVDAEKTLVALIAIPRLRADLLGSCKLELGDVYLINGKPWDATLMYSQVEKAFAGTPVGQDAQYRNAKLAYYTGDFTWAKEQLDILKAETSQFIDNDALNLSLMIGDHTVFDSTANALKMYAHADLLIFKGEPDHAVITLDSIDKVYPLNDLGNDILMAKAHILIQKKEYQAAIVPLKKIAVESQKDFWADDAVFMLGDIYQNHLDDKTAAQSWYQKIISDYPSSLWINEARKRFRILRGDTTPSS